ncbi:hypothetical protein Q5705_07735 [Kosakonia sp. H02]|nr:hypothetical protein Q5705_07735 [Kosakonia sp. H02]
MLSGCSEKALKISPCPINLVPLSLLEPCRAPNFDVQSWGDYPDYVVRLDLALEKCNTDKMTVADLLRKISAEQ